MGQPGAESPGPPEKHEGLKVTLDSTLKILSEKGSLSFLDAKKSMDEIMSGQIPPAKLAAWLTALKAKGETSAEIAGCAASLRENLTPVKCADTNAVDTCGTGGDGAGTFNVSTAAAFVAAGAGITVAKHGNRSVSSSSGSADILSALGVNVNSSVSTMEKCLDEIGIAFLFAPLLHPAMKSAMPVRRELGFRTVFNIIGPLANPAGIKRAVIGVFSEKLCSPVAEAALQLGYEHAIIVHGLDGLDEMTTTADTKICEVRNGKINEYLFSPEKYGIAKASPDDLKGGTPAENAETMGKIFSGEIHGQLKEIVVLNAAAALLVSGKFDSWKSALEASRRSIESGAAAEKLEKLVEYTSVTLSHG